jgi:hypothetical protein
MCTATQRGQQQSLKNSTIPVVPLLWQHLQHQLQEKSSVNKAKTWPAAPKSQQAVSHTCHLQRYKYSTLSNSRRLHASQKKSAAKLSPPA